MSKSKMILAGIAGTIVLVVLALAFFVWQAYSDKAKAVGGDDEEGTSGLETVVGLAESLSRKPVYPCMESVKAIEANLGAVDDWRKEGLALASRGDKVYPRTTPAQFKTDLVKDAKRLMDFPGAADGKLVKPDFGFGPFRSYIVEGKMPSEAELGDLQRKWDDVVTITELLATNGVAELIDVQFKAVAEKDAQDAKGKKDKKGKGDRKRAKSDDRTVEQSISSHSYVFAFAARPPALVKILNEFEQCERFVVVDDFAFVRPGDGIAEALGGNEKKSGQQASGGRRSRRGRRPNAKEEPASGTKGEDEAKGGFVTDPQLDAPMTVTMTVTVHDFRSLEEGESEEAETQPLQKGASK